jgi:hypothetical protein
VRWIANRDRNKTTKEKKEEEEDRKNANLLYITASVVLLIDA